MPHELKQANDTLMALSLFGPAGIVLYPVCTQFLIVQLMATGALRPFPWGAYELGPPELGLAAKLSGGGRRR